MRSIPIFLFSVLLISSVSCKQKIVDKHTAQLDSAIAVIEAAQLAASSISMEKLMQVKPVYAGYVKFFTEEYDDFSDTSFYMNELNDMARCNKYVGRSVDGLDGWKKELDLTHVQLRNLKQDYENGLLPEEELVTYLNNELFATYQINSQIQKNVGMASDCLRNFKELTDVLDSVRVAYLAEKAESE